MSAFLRVFWIAVVAIMAGWSALAEAEAAGLRRTIYRMPVQLPGQALVHLHVEELGRGAPLVMLHGIGGSGYSFRHIAGQLARRHRVILIDLKGFGRSDKPFDANYGPETQAQLVATVIRQRHLTNVTLLGHSFGGAVALLATLELNRITPGLIGRLVLMNAPAFPQEIPRAQHFLTLPVVPHIALAAVPPFLVVRNSLQTVRRLAPPPTDADTIVFADPLYEAGGRHALIATTRAMADAAKRQAVPPYHLVQQPTLIIWCAADPTVPLITGQRLSRTMPRARLNVLDHCEHSPAEEQPVETRQLIEAFLRR